MLSITPSCAFTGSAWIAGSTHEQQRSHGRLKARKHRPTDRISAGPLNDVYTHGSCPWQVRRMFGDAAYPSLCSGLARSRPIPHEGDMVLRVIQELWGNHTRLPRHELGDPYTRRRHSMYIPVPCSPLLKLFRLAAEESTLGLLQQGVEEGGDFSSRTGQASLDRSLALLTDRTFTTDAFELRVWYRCTGVNRTRGGCGSCST